MTLVAYARPLFAVAALLFGTSLTAEGGKASEHENSAPPDFLQEARRFRNATIGQQELALETLSLMPGTPWLLPTLDRSQVLQAMGAIWPDFFGNTVVAELALDDDLTEVLYYNPLLDVAIATLWAHSDRGDVVTAQISSMRALPGEHLKGDDNGVHQSPLWMGSLDPIGTLVESARMRVASFRGGRREQNSDAYDVAVEGMQAIIPRLHWLVEQKGKWGDAKWIEPLLLAIEDDLSMRDPMELLARAPQSGLETATALSALDRAFISQLGLDVVLEQDRTRFVVLSSLLDGRYYLFVKCELTSDQARCVPIQYTWIDVLGEDHDG